MANTPQKFKTKVQADAGVQITTETANRAMVFDAQKNLVASVTTDTELSYVSGVTGSVQTQLNMAASESAQASSDAAAALAAAQAAQADIDAHEAQATGAHAASAISVVPTGNLTQTQVQSALVAHQVALDAAALVSTKVDNLVTLTGVAANSTNLGTFTGSVIPDAASIKSALQALETEIETIPDPIYYAGTYNASTNVPALANTDTGKNGALYQVNVAGTHDFGAGPISFEVGDKVVNNGTIWDKWDLTDAVNSVNGKVGVVVLTTTDIAEGTNLYYSDERAQDAVGAMVVSSPTVSLTYVDATPSLTAVAITQMSITSDASGLKLSGDSATPAATNYYGTNASGVKGFYAIPAVGATGDIQVTSFATANNVSSPANVTGLAFANATVRSFEAQVSVAISATANTFEVFKLTAVQKGFNWDMSISSVGDDSGIVFSITNAGQVQYISNNVSGFTAGKLSFRAQVTLV